MCLQAKLSPGEDGCGYEYNYIHNPHYTHLHVLSQIIVQGAQPCTFKRQIKSLGHNLIRKLLMLFLVTSNIAMSVQAPCLLQGWADTPSVQLAPLVQLAHQVSNVIPVVVTMEPSK